MQLGANERDLLIEFAQHTQDELSPRDLGSTRGESTFLMLEANDGSIPEGEDVLRATPVDVYFDEAELNAVKIEVYSSLDDVGRLDLLPSLVDGDSLLGIKNARARTTKFLAEQMAMRIAKGDLKGRGAFDGSVELD